MYWIIILLHTNKGTCAMHIVHCALSYTVFSIKINFSLILISIGLYYARPDIASQKNEARWKNLLELLLQRMLALLVKKAHHRGAHLGNKRCWIILFSLLYWGENLKHLSQKVLVIGSGKIWKQSEKYIAGKYHTFPLDKSCLSKICVIHSFSYYTLYFPSLVLLIFFSSGRR